MLLRGGWFLWSETTASWFWDKDFLCQRLSKINLSQLIAVERHIWTGGEKLPRQKWTSATSHWIKLRMLTVFICTKPEYTVLKCHWISSEESLDYCTRQIKISVILTSPNAEYKWVCITERYSSRVFPAARPYDWGWERNCLS